MRKAVSLLFFALFLVSLPGLIGSFRSAPNASFLIGKAIFSFVMLMFGLYFWKPGPPKEGK